ncbi:modular serine protease-like [Choristoneura fumiferana]|uniref:modular serine protease-like n=1 Tax=Choristoneura fumiferana TaxID=7141 RepID=UPI003D15D8B9
MFLCIVVLVLAASVHSAVYTNTPSVCSVNEFTCGDGACVTRESRCDGIQHCADNSDEQDCWNDSSKLDLREIILHRYKRQTACSKGDFHCRDGTCVTFDKKCDGLVDCPDGSDETHALCRNIRCPSNLFRCTYGACADGTAACNGIKECADNSDELLPKCRNEVEEVRGRFTCKNGETIDSTDHCDGVANCSDGSDETIESCAGKRCPSYLFQCAYGACVDNGANCNGKTDCIDGSDEADDLCNRTTIATTYRPAGACVLPEYPKHGKYIVKGIPNAKPHQSYQSAILTVTCDPGYGVVGINTTYCFSGNDWLGSVPTCSRFCKVTPHPSVNYKCKVTGEYGLHGTRLCHEYEPSGTEVIPECNRPNYHHSGFLAHMHCIDGNWDSTAICQPECGTPTSRGEQLVINGVSAKRGELPWHAGIYDKTYHPTMQICGGSLVSTTVVISAAHCFWTAAEKLASPSNYAVALGKIYRPWSEARDNETQKSDVSSLKIPERFMGEGGHFQDDIALVILSTPIVYATFIRPVCLDFDVTFDKKQLQPGKMGKVSGWGLTSQDGPASQVLLTTELPYVSVSQCIADLPFDFRAYITSDKICAGTMNGTALCKGDSGGGLAFPTVDGQGTQRYYLRGVVSTAPRNGHACNANAYTSFTHVQQHQTFISENLNYF